MEAHTVLLKTEWLNSGEVSWCSGICIADFVLTGLDALSSSAATSDLIRPFISQCAVDQLAALPLQISVIRGKTPCDEYDRNRWDQKIINAIPVHLWTCDILSEWCSEFAPQRCLEGPPLGFALLSSTLPQSTQTESFLSDALSSLIEFFPVPSIIEGMPVIVQSSPLGMFHRNMIIEGAVVNTFCYKKLFSVDCPLTEASIGGAVFREFYEGTEDDILNLFGLVIFASSHPIHLKSLCVNINYAISDALSQLLSITPFPQGQHSFVQSLNPLDEFRRQNLFALYSGSADGIAVVRRSVFQGSGVLLENYEIIVTCAHVLNYMEDSLCDPVYILLKGQTIMGDVLYCAKETDPVDLAFIKLLEPPKFPGLKMSSTPVILGEKVTAVGFFSEIGHIEDDPCFSAGVVSCHNHPMAPVTVSCGISGGFSGGAIIRPNQELVAVCFGKMCSQEPSFSFPEMSLCVPVSLFRECFLEYISTKRIGSFNRIQCLDPISRCYWEINIGNINQ